MDRLEAPDHLTGKNTDRLVAVFFFSVSVPSSGELEVLGGVIHKNVSKSSRIQVIFPSFLSPTYFCLF